MMVFRVLILFIIISCAKEDANRILDDEMILFDADSTVQVVGVATTGSDYNYNFSVELASPDTGCEQYADWWEVITTDGELIYRRNLSHSHVNEQPFTRSGGPVNISARDSVIVRGHLNTFGYGVVQMKGTIDGGFAKDVVLTIIAKELESESPLPPKCSF